MTSPEVRKLCALCDRWHGLEGCEGTDPLPDGSRPLREQCPVCTNRGLAQVSTSAGVVQVCTGCGWGLGRVPKAPARRRRRRRRG